MPIWYDHIACWQYFRRKLHFWVAAKTWNASCDNLALFAWPLALMSVLLCCCRRHLTTSLPRQPWRPTSPCPTTPRPSALLPHPLGLSALGWQPHPTQVTTLTALLTITPWKSNPSSSSLSPTVRRWRNCDAKCMESYIPGVKVPSGAWMYIISVCVVYSRQKDFMPKLVHKITVLEGDVPCFEHLCPSSDSNSDCATAELHDVPYVLW